MPYFYAAGHWNYVRDRLVYLRTMKNLPKNVLERFLAGEHVVHLQKGSWNGIWSDMAIECTYTRARKGPSGMIGTTSSERTTTIWASGHHLCGELLSHLEELRSKKNNHTEGVHKEEKPGRIKAELHLLWKNASIL